MASPWAGATPSPSEPEPRMELIIPKVLVVVLKPGEEPLTTPRQKPKDPETPERPDGKAVTHRQDLGLSPHPRR